MKNENGLFDNTSELSIRERLSRYIRYWPYFLISLSFFIGTGYLYTRYTAAKYIATTTILVKDGQTNSSLSNDIIEDALNGKRHPNLNNEIFLLNSVSLMERVVTKYGFNRSYYRKGKILDIDIYLDAPFRLNSSQINDSSKTSSFVISNLNYQGGNIEYGPEKNKNSFSFTWDKPFSIDGNKFVLNRVSLLNKEDGEYVIYWQPIRHVAAYFSSILKVRPFDKQTSILELSIVLENLQKAKDVLNAVAMEFNYADMEERRKLDERTVQFVDDRLANIAGELQGVEGNLENFQGSRQLSDIKTQSTQSIQNSNEIASRIKILNVQQGIVRMLLEYFNNPRNSNKLVPSGMGLEDPTLAALIANYNEIHLRKEREASLVAPGSTVMQDINTQLSNLKGSILESLKNISNNLNLQLAGLQQQNSQYRQFLASVPHNERVLQEIKRKQSITEGLYLYLLQKREEAAISSTAASVPHYRQIDLANGWGPVEPNKRNILLYTALLALSLPFGVIYVRELLNDKVTTKEEITRKIKSPVFGEISHIHKKSRGVSLSKSKDILGEQMRIVRTNLSLLDIEKKKVILITSSAANEGKSFISLNLATVLAMPGKKVALLEFDLRRPSLKKNLEHETVKGLSHYLTGQVTEIGTLFHNSPDIPSLHIYPSGPIPSNPADLLINEHIENLFTHLKRQYDYIIIDTPPAGLVGDPFILSTYCDIALLVIRQGVTLKRNLEFINELVIAGKLSNPGLVINDVPKIHSYEYYGYKNYL